MCQQEIEHNWCEDRPNLHTFAQIIDQIQRNREGNVLAWHRPTEAFHGHQQFNTPVSLLTPQGAKVSLLEWVGATLTLCVQYIILPYIGYMWWNHFERKASTIVLKILLQELSDVCSLPCSSGFLSSTNPSLSSLSLSLRHLR